MQQKRPVSGERQACTESTWQQSNMLSLRVTQGQGPRSVCTVTVTTTRQGACVHQLRSQGIVMTQGTRQGTKQTRSLPSRAPCPVDEEES